MKIIEKEKKIAQEFSQLDDVLDGETTQRYTEYLADDADTFDNAAAIQINEENVEDYLADNYEGEEEAPIEEEVSFEDELDVPFEPPEIEGEDVPDFANTQEAMQWAIDNNRIVKIFYITSGRSRGRGGIRLKREIGLGGGARIHRIVEPHHMFQAGNGNLIVVTYDRSVRHIRAFIVSNIVDYSFTDKNFKQRLKVMPKAKGIRSMKNINANLVKIAAELEGQKFSKSASVVKDSVVTWNEFRIAQYLGVQGYWLRNRRCWDNCYRHKRTTQPETPAQEVWMSCWDEYKDSIQNDSSGWEKYADGEEARKGMEKIDKKFAIEVERKVKEGFTTAEAVYDTIDEQSTKYNDKVIEASADLMILAESFNKNGQKEIGDKIAQISAEMLKEAQLWQGIKNFSKGVKDWWSRNFGGLKSIINSLKELNQLANAVLRGLNRNYQMTASGKRSIIIEAQLGPGGPNYEQNYQQQPESGPPSISTQSLPTKFSLVYNSAQNTIRELSSLISKQPQDSPSLQYLDASVRNLQNFIDQYDEHINNRTLNEQTMVPLLQFLIKMTNQSMAGINASIQQVGGQQPAVDNPLTPQDESNVGSGFGDGQNPAGAIHQNAIAIMELFKMDFPSLKAAFQALGATKQQVASLAGSLQNVAKSLG